MTSLAFMVLPFALLAVWLAFRNDIEEYRAFSLLSSTDARVRTLRFWIAKLVVVCGVGALVGLAAIGRLDTLVRIPRELATVIPPGLFDSSERGGFFLGLGTSMITITIVLVVLRSRSAKPARLGDYEALLPRNATERWWMIVMSIVAGVTEELFFRLLLPLVFAIVLGDAVTACLASVLVFGLAHAYQGWSGIVGTTMAGIVLTGVYLASGSIWAAVGLHIGIDLNSLVLQPWLRSRRTDPKGR